jgi:LysM repeat protein
MTVSSTLFRGGLLLVTVLALVGCVPPGTSRLEEEKEPHFLAGKSRVNSMDYRGAMESFEKALAVNPQSAAAHFELGCLYDQKESEPAAAIYHYEHFLKLRPHADNAEIVHTRILACKQELARSVSLGPVTQGLQNEFERLREENQKLLAEVTQWRANASRLQGLTNPHGQMEVRTAAAPKSGPAQQPAAAVPSTVVVAAQVTPAKAPRPPAAAAARTHTIKSGDTPTGIARKYGVKVEALLAANPRTDARRLQPGQTLSIPGL